MSNNKEKLNEQLFNVIADEKVSDEVRLKKLKYLVYFGADVNARLYGKSLLSKALELQDEEVISFLKSKGAKEWVIPKEEALELGQGFWNDTGDLKSLEEIKELLKKGADVNAKNDYGCTAISRAGREGLLEVAKYLFENGADVNEKDNDGQTALMKAATWGKLDVVKYLTECGAELDVKDKYGVTALMEAAYYGRLGVVKYLAQKGADLDVSDMYGKTALDIAKELKRDDCVEFLEEAQKKNSARKNQGDKTGVSHIVKAKEGR